MEGYINKNKWVDLSKLPRKKHGERICIDWNKSVGEELPFLYDGISGKIKILKYNKSNHSFVVYVDGYTPPDGDTIYLGTIKNCEFKRLLTKKIIDTAPEMIKYLKDKSDAYKYTCKSNKYITVVCPICGHEKQQTIYNLFKQGFSCPHCSDKISFPNKLMAAILKQLKVDFINEVTKSKSGFEWVGPYRYDFYFETNNQKYFIEMDGEFHYVDHFRTSNEVQKNDHEKDMLAEKHNVQMIRINCLYTSVNDRFDLIKNNIINSKLYYVFDFSMVDWNSAHKDALKNYVVLASQYWNLGYPVAEISNTLKINRHTTCAYLKIATDVGMCDYNKKESRSRIKYNSFHQKRKPVAVYKNGCLINVFRSIISLERESLKLYGIYMHNSNISKVCNGYFDRMYGYEFAHIVYDEYERLSLCFDPTIQNEYDSLQEVI